VRIAVLCPSRSRHDDLRRLGWSVRKTSGAELLAYIDEDQRELYPPTDYIRTFYGPRIGPVASANELVRRAPDFDVYGLVTDDATLTIEHWDQWVSEAVNQFPNRVCVISPAHNQGGHVDMPFVSREWINAVGWFACPDCYHYCWPIITGLIGEMSAIVHAPEQSFAVHHPHKVEMVSESLRNREAQAFFEFVSLKLPAVVDRVRQAMSA